MNPKVDNYFNKAKKWKAECLELRTILLESGLNEEFKWACPCYTYQKANIVLIHGFKNYCALLFMKGALLKDNKKILVQQTENVRAARQIRFTNMKAIKKIENEIKAYIHEAIENEKAGLKVELHKPTPGNFPHELKKILKNTPNLKTAFSHLTPGRQRAYLLYFNSAKQSATREARIKKCIQKIIKGKGLDDK